MAEKGIVGKLAIWAFIGGLLLAIVFGIYQAYTLEHPPVFFGTDAGGWVAWILAILGGIVGLLAFLGKGTITSKEIPAFLLAGVSLLVMYGVFGGLSHVITPYIGSLLAGISLSVAIFIAPAVAILAIKAVWDIGKEV
jgi:hypothetical protein